MDKELKALAPVLGEDKAKELLKLTSNYDKYIAKFKKNINSLLDPIGFEAKTGFAVFKKDNKVKEPAPVIRAYALVKVGEMEYVPRTFYIQDGEVIKVEDGKGNVKEYGIAYIRKQLIEVAQSESKSE